MGVNCQFGLQQGDQRKPNRTDRTYIEDMKDPGEILPPGRDRFLIVLRTEESGDRVSVALLDHILLDTTHSSTVGLVRISLDFGGIANPTHVVRCSIAPSTDWFSLPNRLPSSPLSKARHTSAQDKPSST